MLNWLGLDNCSITAVTSYWALVVMLAQCYLVRVDDGGDDLFLSFFLSSPPLFLSLVPNFGLSRVCNLGPV